MNERAAAEDHLRVIRSLMERATVYRAISAPTALVGGLSAVAISGWLFWRSEEAALTPQEFAAAWVCALLLTVTANALFIWQEARRDHRPFFSPGLRLALRSVIPSLFVAGVFSAVLLWRGTDTLALALTWIAFYGLALLATVNFAPRSLSILGWGFVLAAIGWLLLMSSGTSWAEASTGDLGVTLAMGVTFGLFHLVYAACTWRRGSAVAHDLRSE